MAQLRIDRRRLHQNVPVIEMTQPVGGGQPATWLIQSNVARWLLSVVIGSIAVTGWRLLIYDPGSATTETWLNVGIGTVQYLVVLGSPLAFVDVLLLRRLRPPHERGRLAMLGLATATGMVWFFFALSANLAGVDPVVFVAHLFPWLLFGMLARVD
jgi:hypothetical protein